MVRRKKQTKNITPPKGEIITTSFPDKFKKDYLEYGLSVIMGRAIPRVEDGLKPVQRRVIYTMDEDHLTSDKGRKKSAKVVGDVMGKYHPHGDSSIYSSLITMSQDWLNPIPPINIKGNNGSVSGASPAAMRYTETRLSKFGDLFTKNLKPGVVDFVSNFSDDETEPTLLPVEIPYLLIAGANGIAVGVATHIPAHNPEEAVKATIAYLKNPKISIADLMKIMPGPDFPTGGEIINKKDLVDFYKTGSGRLLAQGHAKSISKTKIRIDGIPFTKAGQVDDMYEKMADQIKDKTIPGALSIADFSNKNGIDIEITTKSGANHERIINNIYAKTALQDTQGLNFLAIVDGAPQQLPLKEYFAYYSNYQHVLISNRFKLEKAKAQKRLELVDGLIKVFPDIDAVIDLVRNSPNSKTMKDALTKGKVTGINWQLKKHETAVKKFSFSETQAEAILSTPLRRLSKLDETALNSEKKELEKTIKTADSFLTSKIKRKNLLIKTLTKYLDMFKDIKRKTLLVDRKKAVANLKAEILNVVISIDKFGYVRQMVDPKGDIDNEVSHFTTKSDDQFGVFTNEGNFYKYKLSKVPISKPKDKGDSLAGLAKMATSEHGLLGSFGDVMPFSKLKTEKVIQATSDGLAKIVEGDQFISTRSKTVGIKLKDPHAQLVASQILKPDTTLLVFVSKKGLVKKIKLSDVKEYGKVSAGSVMSKPNEEDEVVSLFQVKDNKTKLKINNKEITAGDIRLSKPAHTMKEI